MLSKAALLCLLAALGILSGQSPRPASPGKSDAAPFQTAVQPLLQAHCYGCHNSKLSSGQLDLTAFKTAASVAANRDRWELVLKRLKGGEMPPPPLPRPAEPGIRKQPVLARGSVPEKLLTRT